MTYISNSHDSQCVNVTVVTETISMYWFIFVIYILLKSLTNYLISVITLCAIIFQTRIWFTRNLFLFLQVSYIGDIIYRKVQMQKSLVHKLIEPHDRIVLRRCQVHCRMFGCGAVHIHVCIINLRETGGLFGSPKEMDVSEAKISHRQGHPNSPVLCLLHPLYPHVCMRTLSSINWPLTKLLSVVCINRRKKRSLSLICRQKRERESFNHNLITDSAF